EHVVDAAQGTNPDKIVTVVGTGASDVKSVLAGKSEFAFQKEQLGTGHAVLATADLLKNLSGYTIVTTGDTPLFTAATFNE
ncbi:bifunctional UDP-N-acetylglucosamine diphosphorylase/glucosamine-1-phosphate N-acetyltransferase GlmU, partial [Klebsiella pneumoniae]|nr:bifunctional UDP-N-acetylglucosamine diphosphorylase/glucosamine-1-phosphate N-acetyltransferase GlmU [Klebsiella pneumoniae]